MGILLDGVCHIQSHRTKYGSSERTYGLCVRIVCPRFAPSDLVNPLDLKFFMPYYVRVSDREVNRVRMFIRDDDLDPCRFKIELLYCMLHLRRRRLVR